MQRRADALYEQAGQDMGDGFVIKRKVDALADLQPPYGQGKRSIKPSGLGFRLPN